MESAIDTGVNQVDGSQGIRVNQIAPFRHNAAVGVLPDFVGVLVRTSLNALNLLFVSELRRVNAEVGGSDNLFAFANRNINGTGTIERQQNRSQNQCRCQCADENSNLLQARR